jgi:hypothetical protein
MLWMPAGSSRKGNIETQYVKFYLYQNLVCSHLTARQEIVNSDVIIMQFERWSTTETSKIFMGGGGGGIVYF